MLFNTLAYAKFFAFVFVLAWLLVQRKNAALLPWVAVFGFALWHPSLLSAGIAGLALALTLPLLRGAGPGPLDARRTLAALATNLVALWFLTHRQTGMDPVSLGLTALGTGDPGPWRWALIPLAVLTAFFVLSASKVRL